MSLLEIKNLKVSFKNNEVVHGISFNLDKNETLAIVGESGSGKTVSALSIMSLIEAKIDGEILLNQKSIKGDKSIRGKDIGMIFQEPMTSLNPLHKIGKQIEEVFLIHKIPYDLNKIIELLQMVGFNDAESKIHSYPFELSGGQRQRVMIAMALASRPKILIADEPTTALDVVIQDQIIKLLKELQQKMELAILFITHDLSLVEKFADKIAVMKDGNIVEFGKKQELLKNPTHEYTKELLSSIPKGINENEIKCKEVLKCENIVVKYDDFTAVNSISFDLKEKETLGILGESGSGKTSLGMGILKLTEVSGKIMLNDIDISHLKINELRPYRKDIGVVFQDPFASLNPRMSIFEIVKEGLDVHFKKLTKLEKENMVVEALNEVGLNKNIINRYPHELSGGQRQRIAIARAIITKPKIIILDEPTSALDVRIQSQIIKLLQDLQAKHNISYIFISHDIKVVRMISNKIFVMKNGNVVEFGKTKEIFKNPQHEYTKLLFSSAL